MSLTDRYGLPVTAASRAAVDAYDRSRSLLERRLAMRRNPGHYRTTVRSAPSTERARMIDRKSLAPAGA